MASANEFPESNFYAKKYFFATICFFLILFLSIYIISCFCCSFVKRDKEHSFSLLLKTRSNSIFRIFNAESKEYIYILHVNVPTHIYIRASARGELWGRRNEAAAAEKNISKKEIKKSIFMMR